VSGDLALRRSIQRAYGFDHLPTEAEVAHVSDRWRPYRSLAVSYLFASEYDANPRILQLTSSSATFTSSFSSVMLASNAAPYVAARHFRLPAAVDLQS
jgi:hypothetical protein